MIYRPPAKTVTPLIVAGPPRSGTRFITNVLNKVPGVTLNGEIPIAVMNQVVRVIKKCDQTYGKSDDHRIAQNWNLARRDYMFVTWMGLNKSKGKKISSDCVYFGYKSPLHERYFDFYRAFFHPVHPMYVCCVRSFPDHFLSVQARWPRLPLIYVALKYVLSLKQIRFMKEAAPHQVVLFFLDDYKKSGNPYLIEKIFKPLGLQKTAKAIQTAERGPANSSEQLGVTKKNKLNQIQELLLKIYSKPLAVYDALRCDFG